MKLYFAITALGLLLTTVATPSFAAEGAAKPESACCKKEGCCDSCCTEKKDCCKDSCCDDAANCCADGACE